MGSIKAIVQQTTVAINQPTHKLVVRPVGTIDLGGGGATTMAALTDTEFTDLQVDDVPKWDGSKWVNQPDATGGGGGGGPVAWDDVTGKPSVFPPDLAEIPVPVFIDYDTYTGDYTEFSTGTLLFAFADGEALSIEEVTGPGTVVPRINFPYVTSLNIADIVALPDALASKQNLSEKGAAGGYASLDGGGKVPASQLPSYVDDILDFADLASFPVTGETGKIYFANDTGKQYRWSGSSYAEIVASPGSTDSVTEGSTNLYFTLSLIHI